MLELSAISFTLSNIAETRGKRPKPFTSQICSKDRNGEYNWEKVSQQLGRQTVMSLFDGTRGVISLS